MSLGDVAAHRATTDTPPLIALRGVSKTFVSRDGAEVHAVQDVTLDVQRGEFVSIVGPSGFGKSTLLNMMVGLVVLSRGEVVRDGGALGGRQGWAGYMTQADALLPWRTVLDNAAIGLELQGVRRTERRARAHHLLAKVGLADVAGRYPAELSGGMRKRLSLVCVLAYEPEALVLDEPFSAVDVQLREILHQDLLRLWRESGKTIIFVTHDLHEAIALADRVVLMTDRPGRIKGEYTVELPRPRPMFEAQFLPGFIDLYRTIWSDLKDEVLKAHADILRYNRLRLRLARVLIVTACVAAWQAAVVARLVDPFFVSSPLAVAHDLVALFSTGMVWPHLWVTLLETLGGFSLGAMLGLLVGLGLGVAPQWCHILDPLLVAVYGLPRVALAPLFILWFGLGMLSKMVFGLSLVFFLVLFNTLAGVRAQRPEILDALRVMGATRLQLLTKVTLPSIAPWVFAGLKSGLGMALLGAVLGEYVGGTEGLGWLIQHAAGLFQTTRVFSSLVVLMVLLSAVLNAAEARLLHWRPVDRAW